MYSINVIMYLSVRYYFFPGLDFISYLSPQVFISCAHFCITLSVVKPSDAFFFTHRRLHHPASKDTIVRWVKTVLHLSGVNIEIYKPHSCRSASASHAKIAGVPLEVVLWAGQWKSLDCFTRFYDRVIERTDFTVTQQFASSILDGAP